MRDWFEAGDAIVESLAAATHRELDPRTLDEGYVRQWQAIGRELERRIRRNYADMGDAVKQSGMDKDAAAEALAAATADGMSADEALEALRRGDLRP